MSRLIRERLTERAAMFDLIMDDVAIVRCAVCTHSSFERHTHARPSLSPAPVVTRRT